jgi:hypothetical protein
MAAKQKRFTRSSVQRAMRVPSVVAGVVILVVVGCYYYWVREQNAYYISRDLRMLAALSSQLDAAITTHENFLRNYAERFNDPKAKGAVKPPPPIRRSPAIDQDEIDAYAPDFDSIAIGCSRVSAPRDTGKKPGDADKSNTPSPDPEKAFRDELERAPKREIFRSELAEDRGVLTLHVDYAKLVQPGTTPHQGDVKGSPAAQEPPPTVLKACGDLPLSRLTRPLFSRELLDTFDTILLAEGGGRVLYSVHPPHQASTLLMGALPASDDKGDRQPLAPGITTGKLGKFFEHHLLGSDTPLYVASLSEATQQQTVQLSGETFRLFTQPCDFAAPPAVRADGKGQDTQHWIIGGLISESRFRYETLAISPSMIFLICGLLILAICSWPFLRVALIAEHQALTIGDVVLIGVCGVVGASIMTLILLDYLEYQRLAAGADQQLRDFGVQLEQDFTGDLFRARNALEAIYRWDQRMPRLQTGDLENLASSSDPASAAAERRETGQPASAGSQPPADPRAAAVRAKQKCLLELPEVKQYPYFSYFAWVDSEGNQVRKGSMRGNTTSPNVAEREYFRAALKDEWWYVRPPQGPPGSCRSNDGKPDSLVRLPYILASVRSLTNGKPEAVIAMPAPDKPAETGKDPCPLQPQPAVEKATAKSPAAAPEEPKTPVLTLTCQLIHLYASVPPPGVEFAIIDEQGNVVFHSDPERNGQENFFVETDNSRRLRAAVLARQVALVETRYWGEEHSVYTRPLMNSGLTLLTLRSHRLLQAANAEAVLLTVLCLLLNSSPYLMVLLALVLLAPAYRAPWLWPNRGYETQYLHLAEVFVATIATTLCCTRFLEPPLLLYVIFAAPLKGIVSAYLVMAKRRTTTWWVLFGTWWAAVASIVYGISMAKLDLDLSDHSLLLGLDKALVYYWALVCALYLLLLIDVVVSLREILRFDFGEEAAVTDHGPRAPSSAIPQMIRPGPQETGAPGAPSMTPTAPAASDLAARLIAGLRSAWLAGAARGWRSTTPFEPPWLLRYPGIYYVSGVLLLVVAAVVPTVGFFKLGGRLEQETLIKYSQLRLASSIEDRINRVGELAFETPDACAVRTDLTDFDPPVMWATGWRLRPPPITAGKELLNPTHAALGRNERLVPEAMSSFVPHYSDDAVAMRQLYGGGSTDRIWRWHREEGRFIVLDRLVRLTNLSKSHTAQLYGPGPPRQSCPPFQVCPPRHEHLTIWSVVPPLLTMFTAAPKLDLRGPITSEQSLDDFAIVDLLYTLLCLTLMAGLLGVLAWITHFVATRILLLDVAEPLWLRNLPVSPTLGDHIFLVRRERPLDTVIGGHNPQGFHTVSFQKLATSDSWMGELIEIDQGESGRNVCITDFEYEIDLPEMNAKKLAWLEKLMTLPDRTVLLVSTITPLFITIVPESPPPSAPRRPWFHIARTRTVETIPRPPSEQERWQKILGSFVTVTGEQLDLAQHADAPLALPLRHDGSARSIRLARWLWEETRHDPFLRKLAYELDCTSERAQLVDELRERADTYFAGLWRSCSSEEKVLLFQLAKSGLVNGTNRRIIRRLMARGLVRREPNFKLFSQTFGLYVLATGRREEVVETAREEHPRSQWDSLRVPLFVVIGTLLLLMFATQKDLLSATTALATVLTTGLPVLVKLIGMFTEHRMETNDRPL